MSTPHAPVDGLAAALADVAAHYGLPSNLTTIVAGLPLVDGRLPKEYAQLAAEKAGLLFQKKSLAVHKLAESDLPVIITLKTGELIVLWSIEHSQPAHRSTATISNPGAAADKGTVPLLELAQTSTDDLMTVRPAANFDTRANDAAAKPERNWFLHAFWDSRIIYLQAIAATFAVNTLALAVPLFSMNVYDRVLPNAAEETLWALGIGVILAIVFDFFIRTLRAVFVDAASRRADVNLANFIYGRLIGAKLVARPASIGVRSNTMREFETLREFFNSATVTAFGDFPFLILFIGVIYLVAGPLAYIVLGAIPIVLLVGWLTQRALDKLILTAFRETAQKNAVVVETLVGISDIKTAGAESWAARKWEQALAEHVRTGLKIRYRSNLGLHFAQMCQTLVQVLIVLVGFYSVAAGELTMGALIAATILAGRAMAPLGQATALLVRLNQARIAYRSLTEIVNAPQERPLGKSFLVRNHFAGAIQFENVTFHYDPEAPAALSDINFRVEPGERVGLIGSIGSGKTTALRLVQNHFQPDPGRVLLDDVAVSQLDPVVLREHVGLMLQNAELFHGTIRENIAMGDPSATDDAILEAAWVSNALSWINHLPLGFNTPLQERGNGLSGGQKQSVVLTRAVLRRPRLLLLDEPTSNMDGSSETAVIASLRRAFKGHTLLLVTHRPALLKLVDRLIVFHQGKVIEDGAKKDVLARLKERSTIKPVSSPLQRSSVA